MITAIRCLTWLVLAIAVVLGIIGLISLFVDIPGMMLNGESVKTLDQKIKLLYFSVGLIGVSWVMIYLLRPKIIRRYRWTSNIAVWFEGILGDNLNGRRNIVVGIVILSVIAVFIAPGLDLPERIAGIILIPFGFGICFLLTLLVVGFQVINPFCPEPVLRFFGLFSSSFFFIGAIVSIPAMFIFPISDPAIFMMPSGNLGAAAGAAYVLRRWTSYKPENYEYSA